MWQKNDTVYGQFQTFGGLNVPIWMQKNYLSPSCHNKCANFSMTDCFVRIYLRYGPSVYYLVYSGDFKLVSCNIFIKYLIYGVDLTFFLPNFLYGIIHLTFLAVFIIFFRDIKMLTLSWLANSIGPGQTALLCRLV